MTDFTWLLLLCISVLGSALYCWWGISPCRKKTNLKTVAVTKFAFLKTNTVVPVLYKREVRCGQCGEYFGGHATDGTDICTCHDKKLHDALDIISKPAVVTTTPICYCCGQDIVPPTRWLPLPDDKKICSKCYENADVI